MGETVYMSVMDLYHWCETESVFHFSAKEGRKGIVLRTNGLFSLDYVSSEATPDLDEDHIPVTLIACHCGKNRNNSVISKETMEEALPSFQMKPILANIVKKEDGTWDFGSHDMELVDSPFDGEDKRIFYKERQVGTVVGDVHIFHNDELDLDQVEAHGFIEKEYGNGAYEILRDRGDVSVSVELALDEFSFDAKSKLLTIEKFRLTGVTLLGADILPGMMGSNAKLSKLDPEEDDVNSTFSSAIYKMEKKEGETKLPNEKFELNEEIEETVKPEGETPEATPETAEANEEPTTATFEQEGEVTETPEAEGAEEADENVGDETVTDDNAMYRRTYELSHDDVRVRLYEAMADKGDDDERWIWISAVYDDHFVYEVGSRYYKRGYSIDGDAAVVGDERVEVFAQYLTQEEVNALDTMRNDYQALMEYKAGNEAALDNAQKDAVIEDEYYDSIRETEEFQTLVKNRDNYSAAEFEREMSIISDNAKRKVFQISKGASRPAIRLNAEKRSEATDPYGDLFKD